MKFDLIGKSLLFGWLLVAAGCATPNSQVKFDGKTYHGESLVLAGEEPGKLAYPPAPGSTITLRSTYEEKPETIQYQEGRDFTLNAATREIRRTAQSRIPDYKTNVLYGVENFDHGKYRSYGNGPYFVWADYRSNTKIEWPVQSSQVELLSSTRKKLKTGQRVKIVFYGDSITTGAEATRPTLFFGERWVTYLREKYPSADIELFNGATGGDTSGNGIQRLKDKVLKQHPDLVLIGFGMNDHNRAPWGVPLDQFEKNLKTMVEHIRNETGAEVVLYSTFSPNPKWFVSSHNMEAYAQATEKVARENHCAFADVHHNWEALSSRKKPEDLLNNNINHPNDFGHWIYFQVLLKLGL